MELLGSGHKRFITLEGNDATGKSTQLTMLEQWFKRRGFDVLVTREPGGTNVGERIRHLILTSKHEELTPRAEALLFAAARANHIAKVIDPALKKGKIVLCDRYVDSTFAYQGFGSGVDLPWIAELHHTSAGGLMPGLTLLFTLPEQRCLREANDKDLMESRSKQFRARVEEGYLQLARMFPQRFCHIIVNGNPVQVHRQLQQCVRRFLYQPRHRKGGCSGETHSRYCPGQRRS